MSGFFFFLHPSASSFILPLLLDSLVFFGIPTNLSLSRKRYHISHPHSIYIQIILK